MKLTGRPKLIFARSTVLVVGAIISFLPLVWLICATVKSGNDLFRYPLLPFAQLNRLTCSNYTRLFTDRAFGKWMINSIFLAATQTVVAVILTSLGGFAIAKYRFAGRRLIIAILLSVMLLPSQVLLPGSYELMHQMGLLDSYWAVLLPGSISVLGLILFSRAMRGVPDELLSAARIDGCGELRIWWEIALPLIRPMIAAFTLLSFTASWNSFLWPQIVLQNPVKYTLPVGLANMSVLPATQADYGLLMAGTLLSVLPVAILFFSLQKDFIAGLSSGAVKE